MPLGPIRRGQLITPFGVGAIMTIKSGVSLITAGLDHWYEKEASGIDSSDIAISEYEIHEWRLEKLLGVSHFRLPPDYRPSWKTPKMKEMAAKNADLTIPFLRFPKWHFCPQCHLLLERPLTQKGQIECPECRKKRSKSIMAQVGFVAMCSHGHMQDFPWREWVHRSCHPTCQENIYLQATGGATITSQIVKCNCGVSRSLSGITEAYSNPDETALSKELDAGGELYLCQGLRPWLMDEKGGGCGLHLRGAPRSATNVYYAHVQSAILLPKISGGAPEELVSLLENPSYASTIKMLRDSGIEPTPGILRKSPPFKVSLEPYSDSQIEKALKAPQETIGESENAEAASFKDKERQIKLDEYAIFQEERADSNLIIKNADLMLYSDWMREYFEKLLFVERMRETRVFTGFTRIYPDNDQTFTDLRKLLWRKEPIGSDNWLPANIVLGEGIFLKFNLGKLRKWEEQEPVKERVRPLIKRQQKALTEKHWQEREISPRFIMLHTLAHLLINQLTFECGYSSASLRERLYVSGEGKEGMAGILIYTASGDSEGTMGGLVRMGKRQYFEPTLLKALDKARWCSSDPVCMELGASGGQGPGNYNLAACHSCCLASETTCEEFNRFLDRALVIGEPRNEQQIGYFSNLLG